MRLTTKQLALMRVLIEKNQDGSFQDLDQIVGKVSYRPTKQALQFSIRALVKHGLIKKLPMENRRGRIRTVIQATDKGLAVMGRGGAASFVSDPDADYDDILDDILDGVLGS